MENIKSSYKDNKFKISVPTWNDEFALPDGSYSVPDIQDSFWYIIKKHETFVDDPIIKIYTKKTEKIITFKVNTGYRLKLITP